MDEVIGEEYNLRISTAKTMVIVCASEGTTKTQIIASYQVIKAQVKNFMCLGSTIISDGRTKK